MKIGWQKTVIFIYKQSYVTNMWCNLYDSWNDNARWKAGSYLLVYQRDFIKICQYNYQNKLHKKNA